MPANYKTPDVYVEEISTLPPSVAEVSTAIPAFIGYTTKAERNGVNLTNVPTRISTLLEFRSFFGGAPKVAFTVSVDQSNKVQSITQDPLDKQNKLYYALDHYFRNGGSDCYIVSIGPIGTKTKAAFEAGIDALKKEDEPTLIVLAEAASLAANDYYGLCQQALLQCATLKDRFCILDVMRDDVNGADFKGETGIGMQNLKYGAAYYPYLNTSLNYIINDEDVQVTGLQQAGPAVNIPAEPVEVVYVKELTGLKVTYKGAVNETPKVVIEQGNGTNAIAITVADKLLTIRNVGVNGRAASLILEAWNAFADPKAGFDIQTMGDAAQKVPPLGETVLTAPPPVVQPAATGVSLASLKQQQTSVYNAIKQELSKLKVVLPPSPAVAGVYATVDRERGVWKAPANVSLNAVISPVVKITSSDQERLNVDETGGKSINAIRSFFGKGTLIWGARTLAGNDNEWRYVSVRRLFNMIEESAKKASYFAVFEPNDATSWLKVKGMIDSYLYGLWQQGALAGSTPKAAYYVNVGLGTTMTTQDILEGRMIIEIGIAAVRPAEFIVLRFSHKLQEA